MSVVIHEVSHGFAAEMFGDKTARHAGRLTLNPIPHLDLFGSFLIPALLMLSGVGFVVGWAKPVPYNPDNLSNKKWGTIAVASAGILSNLLIALIFGTIIRFVMGSQFAGAGSFISITALIVGVNLALAVFNLTPIPPLDGSKILFGLLPDSFYRVKILLEQWGFFILLIFIIYFSRFLAPIMEFMFSLFTGLRF